MAAVITLRPYQAQGIEFLRRVERGLLADDPGLGKSRQAIEAAEGPTLILSSAMSRLVWQEEVAKWRPDLDWVWASYSSVWRASAAPLRRRWGTVICDEAHQLKNRHAQQTKAVARLALKSERLYLLTGTPMPNWAHEIFQLLRLLHPGDPRFANYWRWIRRWFATWQPPWGGTQVLGLARGWTWEDFARDNGLTERMLRRTREDCLPDLPSLTVQEISVEMAPEQARVYRELKKDYTTLLTSGERLSAWSDGALTTKLAQIQTGLETISPGAGHSGKLDMLRELVAERQEPLVVFCWYRHSAAAAARLCTSLGRRTALVVGGDGDGPEKAAAFQRGDFDVLVGTLGTIAESLTLTRAACCIFVERSWRPSQNEQAVRRLHRLSQQRPVEALHLISAGTLDERILQLLRDKTDEQVQALSAQEFARLL